MRSYLKKNSSLLLAMGAGIGVLSTAYLSARAGYRTAHKLESQDPYMSNRERANIVWRLYLPPAAAAAATIICITGVKRIDARKTLAAQAALAVSQSAYERYREAVVEELGEKKDQLFLANAAEKQVVQNPPPALVAGSGSVLCCELWTMRYFNSDMETLARVVNEVNAYMLAHDQATMDEFYYALGLEYTPSSSESGWQCDKLLKLEYSAILHDGKPVLAFSYNYVKAL